MEILQNIVQNYTNIPSDLFQINLRNVFKREIKDILEPVIGTVDVDIRILDDSKGTAVGLIYFLDGKTVKEFRWPIVYNNN